VDATYRADLREFNELNFARFDAKLEQRLTELDAKWLVRWAELDVKLEQRLTALDAKWLVRWAELDAKVDALGDTLRKELAQRSPRQSSGRSTSSPCGHAQATHGLARGNQS